MGASLRSAAFQLVSTPASQACQHAPASPPLVSTSPCGRLVSTLRPAASLSAFSVLHRGVFDYVPCAPVFVTSDLTGRREVAHGPRYSRSLLKRGQACEAGVLTSG